MRSYRKLYCLLCHFLILFCFGVDLAAQSFYIKKYTVNDGLPSSYILKIYQDSQGFIWIGTFYGLSRFDGKELVNYGYETGLPNLAIDAIFEDHQHRLWVGTRKGMAQIKGKQAIVYPVDDNQLINFVFNIQESRNKALWALTASGLYQFEGDHWKKITLYPGLENRQCRNIVESDTGMLINYGNQLVFKKNNGEFKLSVKNEYNKEGPYYNQLIQYDKQIYLTTAKGLLAINEKDTSYLFSKELLNKYILHFFKDSRDRFWIDTFQDGLMVSMPGDREHLSFKVAVKDNLIAGCVEDREGSVWVANGDGVLRIKSVDYVSYNKDRNPLIVGNNNLIVAPGKNLIAANSSNGLLIYDKNKEIFRKLKLGYSSSFTSRVASRYTVDASCYDDQNRLWLVTREFNLFLVENNILKDLSSLIAKNKEFILGIDYNRKSHAIYICGDTLLTGSEHELHNFRSANDSSCIVLPFKIHCFPNGRTLVCSRQRGFFLIDEQQNCFPVEMSTGIPTNIPGDISIYEDPSGKFWTISSRGMVRYKWNEKMLPVKDIEITTKQGLPNNTISSLAFDSMRRIWATTLSGIVVIEIDSAKNNAVKVNRLTEEQGIVSDNWAEARVIADDNGNVWAGLNTRIIRFNASRFQFEKESPSVAIENIQLNFQETNWSKWTDSLQGIMQLPFQLRLPHNKNNLSISFQAIAFTGNSGLQYSYKLVGADTSWSEPTKSNMVSFVGLPPGKYIFQVRARKSNSELGQPAVFSFIIQQPFWETWWFRLLVVAVAVSLLGMIFRNRIRQVRRKALVQHQLQELEMKALKSQMNPHFIYNAMNSIQALVLGKKTEEASLYISKFGRLLRQVLDNSEKNLITLESELQSLELYIQLEKLRLHVDLQYSIVLGSEIDAEEEEVLPLIFQPFVENALWHGLSSKEGEKKLLISVKTQGNWLITEIQDNGIGRIKSLALNHHKHELNKSKGIKITSKRLTEFNKTPGVPPVEIIDLYDDRHQPAGTKVFIRVKRSDQAPDVLAGKSSR
jgi:hypothetical protein